MEMHAAEIAKLTSEAEKLSFEARHFQLLGDETQQRIAEAALRLADKQRTEDRTLAANKHARVYDFVGGVNSSSAETAMAELGVWSRLSTEPITIRISSPGGSVIDGLALYDFILTLRGQGIHVTTMALGMAASMGSILLQAGDERVVGPNAYVLIHEIAAGTGGKIGEIEDDAKFYRHLNDRLFDILAARSKMRRGTIAARAKRRDWWLSADEALKHGFADRILS